VVITCGVGKAQHDLDIGSLGERLTDVLLARKFKRLVGAKHLQALSVLQRAKQERWPESYPAFRWIESSSLSKLQAAT